MSLLISSSDIMCFCISRQAKAAVTAMKDEMIQVQEKEREMAESAIQTVVSIQTTGIGSGGRVWD